MSTETEEIQSYSPQGLISQALAQNVPIETLERLMDLAERWDAKQAKRKFYEAFTAFQSEIPELIRSKKVGYESKDKTQKINYAFTPLPKMAKAVQPFLLKYGFSYRWEYEEMPETKMKITCVLTHKDGHSEKNFMIVKEDHTGNKNDIQSIGSARSYAERYTLKGVLGLTTADEDNDGQTSGKAKEEIPEPIKKTDENYITKRIKEISTTAELKKYYSSLSEINQQKYLAEFGKRKEEIQGKTK